MSDNRPHSRRPSHIGDRIKYFEDLNDNEGSDNPPKRRNTITGNFIQFNYNFTYTAGGVNRPGSPDKRKMITSTFTFVRKPSIAKKEELRLAYWPKNKSHIHKLFDELFIAVFKRLEVDQLVKARLVCRHWRAIGTTDDIWYEKYVEHWGTPTEAEIAVANRKSSNYTGLIMEGKRNSGISGSGRWMIFYRLRLEQLNLDNGVLVCDVCCD